MKKLSVREEKIKYKTEENYKKKNYIGTQSGKSVEYYSADCAKYSNLSLK